MKRASVVLLAAWVLSISSIALAQNAATQPSVPAVQATAPATAPASAPAVMATVGGVDITSDQVDAVVSRMKDVPEELRGQARAEVLNKLIIQQVVRHFLSAKKIACSDSELAAEKAAINEIAAKNEMTTAQLMASKGITDDMIRDKVRFEKLLDQASTQEKVDAFLKGNPDYFNGAKVKASHILIKCDPIAPTEQQKAARAKLEQIAQDIKAGKVKFEDAAKQFSDCPSKEQGGELGEFTFERMTPAFSVAAFKAKTGEFTPIVRTEFGYHLIKVTGRKTSAETIVEAAKRILLALAQTDNVDTFIKTNPDYFDGTCARASHILIKCDPAATTEEQKAAREKLEKIGADIKSGKVKFEDAAKQYSDCPSKEQGGDLGEFTFEKMTPAFSVAAFKDKTGELTPIVRTEFGFHLIMVTGRKTGAEISAETAKKILLALAQNDVLEQDCPIVIKK